MASATSNSSILTNPECYTLSDSTQCSTELNEASATSNMMIITCKTVKLDAKRTQLVTGINICIPIHFPNSELV